MERGVTFFIFLAGWLSGDDWTEMVSSSEAASSELAVRLSKPGGSWESRGRPLKKGLSESEPRIRGLELITGLDELVLKNL